MIRAGDLLHTVSSNRDDPYFVPYSGFKTMYRNLDSSQESARSQIEESYNKQDKIPSQVKNKY